MPVNDVLLEIKTSLSLYSGHTTITGERLVILDDFVKQQEKLKKIVEESKQILAEASETLKEANRDESILRSVEERLVQAENKLSHVQKELVNLQKENMKFKFENEKVNHTEVHTRFVQFQWLVKDYLAQNDKIHELRTEISSLLHDNLMEDVVQLNPRADFQDVESNMDMSQIIRDSAKNAMQLEYLEERNKRILDLTKKIEEMHKLSLQLALVVQEQQEIINQIEPLIIETDDYVDDGVTIIIDAVQIKWKKYKNQVKIIVIILIVILLIAIALALYFGGLIPRD